ncbi:hypothetical protein EMCRGX_G004280 [Ephydatia muelleri]
MTTPARKAELHTIQTGYPMQMVSVDIMGPLPETQDGCKYVLVAIDHFTRWAEVYAIKNQEATTVSKKLVDEMFCRFSPPEQLHSDQGRQFESELLAEVCSLLKVRKSHTTPYHPRRAADDNSQSATTVQQPVGQPTIADELLDDDDEQPTDNDVQDEDGPAPVPGPRRYPTRDRRIPERYGPYLQH